MTINGKPKSKWVQIGSFLGGLAALIASVTALIETRSKAPEKASRAAHQELVKKLDDLNRDLGKIEDHFNRQLGNLEFRFRNELNAAKADADSVRALFIGFALASRRATSGSGTSRTIEELTKKFEKKLEKLEPAPAPPTASPPPKRLPRSFKRPKSWSIIKRNAQQPPAQMQEDDT